MKYTFPFETWYTLDLTDKLQLRTQFEGFVFDILGYYNFSS